MAKTKVSNTRNKIDGIVADAFERLTYTKADKADFKALGFDDAVARSVESLAKNIAINDNIFLVRRSHKRKPKNFREFSQTFEEMSSKPKATKPSRARAIRAPAAATAVGTYPIGTALEDVKTVIRNFKNLSPGYLIAANDELETKLHMPRRERADLAQLLNLYYLDKGLKLHYGIRDLETQDLVYVGQVAGVVCLPTHNPH